MAVSRPNVVVYQEYSTLSIVAAAPEMEVCVVGPCYQLLDYADDKANCYAADYGALEKRCPITDPTAVVIATPPGIKPGATVKEDSVKVYIDVARVIVMAQDDDALSNAYYAIGDNLFQDFTNTVVSPGDFVDGGVQAGDILIANTGATTTRIATVTSVRSTLTDMAGVYDFLNGNVTYAAIQAGDTITISDDTAPANITRNGTYTVAYVRSDTVLELANTGWTAISQQQVTDNSYTCTVTVTSSNGIVRTGYNAKTGAVLSNESCLRVDRDFTTNPVSGYDEWRVERVVSDIELDSTNITIDGNEVTVAGAITVGTKKVSYGKLYLEYAALRADLQVPISYGSTQELLAELGKYDARNPLLVGAIVAKANTATSIKVYGVTTDYSTFLDNISSIREIYAIVPLTTDVSILASINAVNEQLADPTHALTNGIRQKFRVCLGSVVKPLTETVVAVSSAATTKQIAAAGESGNRTLTLTFDGAATYSFTGTGSVVVPGDRVVITTAGPVYTTYTVSQVLSATSLEVDPDGSEVSTITLEADTSKIKVLQGSTGSDVRVAEYTTSSSDKVIVTGSSMASLWLVLEDTTATYVTDGVLPGDVLYMPTNPNATFSTTYDTWVVDTVLSQTRLSIVNNGRNTVTTVNELPHGVLRAGTGASVSQGHMYYKVLRDLNKDQQVDNMVTIATNFGSKRMVLCYPDAVVVTDLVDGSLTRTVASEPEAADAQPGYYLACAVGGQTAGQPSHQGFTNMQIAGIDSISGSSGYFREEQLTELSNGGIYVFVQDNESSLPYSIHEVTTDVSTLEFGEYMVTKNFDYVSLTFLDTMVPFVGRWNVTPEAVEVVKENLRSVGDTLLKQRVAKLGAPLNSYNIADVAASTKFSDQIEAYIDVSLPMTLNTIGLHLVA